MGKSNVYPFAGTRIVLNCLTLVIAFVCFCNGCHFSAIAVVGVYHATRSIIRWRNRATRRGRATTIKVIGAVARSARSRTPLHAIWGRSNAKSLQSADAT